MARSGINYINVATAAEHLVEQGAEPTVDRVREVLGTGSKSTIAPLLKKWKEGAAKVQAVEGIPTALADSIRTLYTQTVRAAEEGFKEERATLKNSLAEETQKLQAVMSDLNVLNDEHAVLTQERDKLRETLKAEQAESLSLQADILKLQTALEATQLKLSESQEATKELKAENKSLRTHFEHFQAHISEERQKEREEHTSTMNVERQRYMSSMEELDRTRKELRSISSLVQQQAASISSKETEIHDLRKCATEARTEMNNIKLEHTENSQALKKLNVQLDMANNERQQLTEALKYENKTSELLEKNNSRLVAQVEATREKLDELNDKLRLESQEKALIRGQFIQLQSTL